MTAFNMTEERARYLLVAIEELEGARPLGNTSPFCVALDNDLKDWRDDPAVDDTPEISTDLESEVDDIWRRIVDNTDGHGGMLSAGAIVRAVAIELAVIQRRTRTEVDRLDNLGRYASRMTVELEFQRAELKKLREELAMRKGTPPTPVSIEETIRLAPGTYTVKVPPHGVNVEPTPVADSAGVLERLEAAGAGQASATVRIVARELETLYADDAENVLAMNEMRTELDLLQKRLEQNDE